MGDKSKHRKSRKRSRKQASIQRRRKQDGGSRNELDANDYSSSASKRKISTPDAQTIPQTSDSVEEGFILVNFKLLSDFICRNIQCADCSKPNTVTCHLNLLAKMGFAHKIQVRCTECPWSTGFDSSNSLQPGISGGTPVKEINTRMVCFVRSIGRGYSALENFSLFLNSPPPMTSKNYRMVFQRVLKQVKQLPQKAWRGLQWR